METDGHHSTNMTETPALAAYPPSSISDVLCLIATHSHDVVDARTIERLNHANICFIRGDLSKALRSVEAVLSDLDVSQPSYKIAIAFRMFLRSMVGPDPDRWKKDFDEELLAVPGVPMAVYLCIQSDRLWHSGQLFDGLRLNQHALQTSGNVPSLWRLYALLLLAKKLTDLHIRYQAYKVIAKVQRCVYDSGFHAFEGVAQALRAPLYLQAGNLEKALSSATDALHIGRRRESTIGVKLALSVAATAHLRRRRFDEARRYLKLLNTQDTHYILNDSVARAAFAEIALTAAEQGPGAAAEMIRSRWHLLGTDSACFMEDTTRPAWLVAVAARAGDAALAERGLRAIERLAGNNGEVRLLAIAAQYARAVYDGQDPGVPLTLDLAEEPYPGETGHLSLAAPKGPPVPSVIRSLRSADTGPAAEEVPLTLTAREREVAWLVARGMTNRQAAKELGISPHTVNFHLRRIFRKLSISSRAQLAYLLAGG